MATEVSKTAFKAKALEYFRQVESTGTPVVVTDHGKPTVEVRPYCIKTRDPREVLRGSVIKYVNPTEPVDADDWEAAQ